MTMEFLIDFFSYVPGRNFLFTSFSFWIFLCLTLGGFCLLYKNRQARNTFLFVCSLFFYYKIGGYFVFILLLSILFNYGIGIRLETCRKQGQNGKKNFWFAIGLLANLFLLGTFKYDHFFLELWNIAADPQFPGLAYFSLSGQAAFPPAPESSLATFTSALQGFLPAIGISFFTFQALSYLVDVKRGHVPASRNIGDFGCYLSFFPQLVAGPIVRAGQFMPQLQKNYMLSSPEFSRALGLILVGLVKKIVVADYLAVQFTDPVLGNPQAYSGFENWMAMYAFSIRIYCDFSGYTDIALGVAALFDFHLPPNFRSPYKASSLTDFWRRWHISLSSWFRDYLYIPLGGNRHGVLRMGFALLATMALAGLWHGACIGFLLWGLLHGILLLAEKLTGWNRWVERNRFARALGWAVCFHIVSFSWVIFQAPTLPKAFEVFQQMFLPASQEGFATVFSRHGLPLALMAVSAILLLFVKERKKENLARAFCKLPIGWQFVAAVLVAAVLVGMHRIGSPDFIYARF